MFYKFKIYIIIHPAVKPGPKFSRSKSTPSRYLCLAHAAAVCPYCFPLNELYGKSVAPPIQNLF